MKLNRHFEYSGHLHSYQSEKDVPLHERSCFQDAKNYEGRYRSAKDSAALDATILGFIERDGVTTIKKIHRHCVDEGLPIKDNPSGYKIVLLRVQHLLDHKLTNRKQIVDPTRRR